MVDGWVENFVKVFSFSKGKYRSSIFDGTQIDGPDCFKLSINGRN
jgi:hypothetical protein